MSLDLGGLAESAAAVLEAYKAAVYERSVDRLMALYDEDARVFDTWSVWSYQGQMARRKAVEQWFASLGCDRVAVCFDEVEVVAGDEMAMVSAIGTYSAISEEGMELRSMQNRLTWGLRRRESSWKIIHEHTSTPIGSSDLRAILRR